MSEIKSLQNARVKAAVRLRDGRHRRRQGRFLIDGLREVLRGFRAGVSVREVFYCRELCTAEQAQQLDSLLDEMQEVEGGVAADEGGKAASAARLQPELIAVARNVFKKMAFGDRAEGVLAVADLPERGLAGFEPDSENALLAVIEGVEKPGNIGAVVRSADAAGLSAVILADCRTDLFNPAAIRASLGTVLTFPVLEVSTEETLAWLRERRIPIFAARVDGSVPYDEVDYRSRGAIVLGSEAEGLSNAWRGDDVRAVRLPMCGVADSLNISATAAVLFYEALRQQR